MEKILIDINGGKMINVDVSLKTTIYAKMIIFGNLLLVKIKNI